MVYWVESKYSIRTNWGTVCKASWEKPLVQLVLQKCVSDESIYKNNDWLSHGWAYLYLIKPTSHSVKEKVLWINLLEAKRSEIIHTKSEAELGPDQTSLSCLQSLLHQSIPSEVKSWLEFFCPTWKWYRMNKGEPDKNLEIYHLKHFLRTPTPW